MEYYITDGDGTFIHINSAAIIAAPPGTDYNESQLKRLVERGEATMINVVSHFRDVKNTGDLLRLPTSKNEK